MYFTLFRTTGQFKMKIQLVNSKISTMKNSVVIALLFCVTFSSVSHAGKNSSEQEQGDTPPNFAGPGSAPIIIDCNTTMPNPYYREPNATTSDSFSATNQFAAISQTRTRKMLGAVASEVPQELLSKINLDEFAKLVDEYRFTVPKVPKAYRQRFKAPNKFTYDIIDALVLAYADLRATIKDSVTPSVPLLVMIRELPMSFLEGDTVEHIRDAHKLYKMLQKLDKSLFDLSKYSTPKPLQPVTQQCAVLQSKRPLPPVSKNEPPNKKKFIFVNESF